MDIGPGKRKASSIGQLFGYLRSMGIDEPESVPIRFLGRAPCLIGSIRRSAGRTHPV